MKISHKVAVTAVVVSSALVLAGPLVALAATTPSVGTAATYAILGSTYTNGSVTTVNGDVGFTTGPSVAPLGTHTNYGSGAPYATAGTDQGSALSALASQVCTFTFANGPIDLATDITHGSIGVYTPGVYCTGASSAASIGTAGITLSGAGTYIFRVNGALTSVANSSVTLAGGASACDVFWTPTAATTLGANSTFVGTNIDASGITVGNSSSWTGRALAFGGTVTTDTDTITAPTCGGAPVVTTTTAAATTTTTTTTVTPTTPTVVSPTTITIVKTVINDNGRTRTAASFPLFVNGTPVVSGVANSFSAGTYAVVETGDANYSQTFSGDCDMYGVVSLIAGDNKTCTITNNDVAAVVVPTLPNTGIPPRSGAMPWDIFMSAGILMLLSTSLVVALRKR